MSTPETTTAAALLACALPELRWAVTGLLPEGLVILAARPKLGKSWLVLNVGLEIATGGRALGALPVEAGEVLYLALEDGQRRLQQRLVTMLEDGTGAPARLHFATAWPRLPEAADHLGVWLTDHPACRLVVVDTLARIRERQKRRTDTSAYDLDYDGLVPLKAIADRFGIALVLVHHTRKMAAADPIDLVNGTLGLSGAADAVLVLERKRGEADAILHVTGRDVDEATYALRFEPGAGAWTILDLEIPDAGAERNAIARFARTAGRAVTPSEVATALGRPPGTIRRLMWGMAGAGQLLGSGRTGYTLPNTHEPGERSERGERWEDERSPSTLSVRLVRPQSDEADWLAAPLPPAPVDPDTIACGDYSAHQLLHRRSGSGWTCDACNQEAQP